MGVSGWGGKCLLSGAGNLQEQKCCWAEKPLNEICATTAAASTASGAPCLVPLSFLGLLFLASVSSLAKNSLWDADER